MAKDIPLGGFEDPCGYDASYPDDKPVYVDAAARCANGTTPVIATNAPTAPTLIAREYSRPRDFMLPPMN